ncbi:MAG: hypothetical protein WKF88_01730 [Ferruginibacter sp.]
MLLNIKRVFAALLMVPVLVSCATYNKSMDGYYANLRDHNYSKAMHSLEHSKLMQKNRNALLFNLEMGKLYRLQNDFVNSNMYLNRADNLMAGNRKSFTDIAMGNLLNPMHTSYRGEDFEQFMMHYYKALNYAALVQNEDAVVEARRITVSANAQGEKFKNKEAHYSRDAFAFNVQGMIYEMAGDMNNAFIAYRNAAEMYSGSNNEYYGVQMPVQLRADLVRTAAMMGFAGEQDQFEKLYRVSYAEKPAVAGELILFIEEGQAPVKQEKNFILTAGKNGISSFYFTDANGLNSEFNFNYNSYGIAGDKLTSQRAFRIALPQYSVQYPQRQNVDVHVNGISYTPQLGQDLNNVAVNVLKERFLLEMGNALARQITKKLVEKGTEAVANEAAKSNDKKEDKNADEAEKEKEKKKKEERAKHTGEMAGFLMNVINTATEKADTRNWQSLPAYVSYVRVPLTAGENDITVSVNGKPVTMKIMGGKGLQMRGLSVN